MEKNNTTHKVNSRVAAYALPFLQIRLILMNNSINIHSKGGITEIKALQHIQEATEREK